MDDMYDLNIGFQNLNLGQPERRYDNDGELYTLREFIDYYGRKKGRRKWKTARPEELYMSDIEEYDNDDDDDYFRGPNSGESKEEPKCMICMDSLSNTENGTVRTLPCGHSFHLDCINGWISTYPRREQDSETGDEGRITIRHPECPICKTRIKVNGRNVKPKHGIRGGVERKYNRKKNKGVRKRKKNTRKRNKKKRTRKTKRKHKKKKRKTKRR
tara:strand:- start:2211 stop:2855 length:645 start_codon:yes stop_codon:yes gene_type:complete